MYRLNRFHLLTAGAIVAFIALNGVFLQTSRENGYVTLTFDDGLISNINAADMLENYGYRGVFFISTGISTFEGRPLMNHSQISMLHKRGHEIGSHTATHPRVSKLLPQQFEIEIINNNLDLQKINIKPVSFAYPFGEGLHYEGIVKKYFAAARTSERCINELSMEQQTRYKLCSWELGAANYTSITEALETTRKMGGWLIIVLHDITDQNPREQFDLTSSQLNFVLNKIKESGLKVITIEDDIKRGLFGS